MDFHSNLTNPPQKFSLPTRPLEASPVTKPSTSTTPASSVNSSTVSTAATLVLHLEPGEVPEFTIKPKKPFSGFLISSTAAPSEVDLLLKNAKNGSSLSFKALQAAAQKQSPPGLTLFQLSKFSQIQEKNIKDLKKNTLPQLVALRKYYATEIAEAKANGTFCKPFEDARKPVLDQVVDARRELKAVRSELESLRKMADPSSTGKLQKLLRTQEKIADILDSYSSPLIEVGAVALIKMEKEFKALPSQKDPVAAVAAIGRIEEQLTKLENMSAALVAVGDTRRATNLDNRAEKVKNDLANRVKNINHEIAKLQSHVNSEGTEVKGKLTQLNAEKNAILKILDKPTTTPQSAGTKDRLPLTTEIQIQKEIGKLEKSLAEIKTPAADVLKRDLKILQNRTLTASSDPAALKKAILRSLSVVESSIEVVKPPLDPEIKRLKNIQEVVKEANDMGGKVVLKSDPVEKTQWVEVAKREPGLNFTKATSDETTAVLDYIAREVSRNAADDRSEVNQMCREIIAGVSQKPSWFQDALKNNPTRKEQFETAEGISSHKNRLDVLKGIELKEPEENPSGLVLQLLNELESIATSNPKLLTECRECLQKFKETPWIANMISKSEEFPEVATKVKALSDQTVPKYTEFWQGLLEGNTKADGTKISAEQAQKNFLFSYRNFMKNECFQELKQSSPSERLFELLGKKYAAAGKDEQKAILKMVNEWVKNPVINCGEPIPSSISYFTSTASASDDPDIQSLRKDLAHNINNPAVVTPIPIKVVKDAPHVMERMQQIIDRLVSNDPLTRLERGTSEYDAAVAEIARFRVIMGAETFESIQVNKETANNAWVGTKKTELSPNIAKMTEEFNQFSEAVASLVVAQPTPEGQAKAISFLVDLQTDLIHNQPVIEINSAMAITSALTSSPIHRLEKPKQFLSEDVVKAKAQNENLLKREENYKEVRALMTKPHIPFPGIALTDITFASDGNPTMQSNQQLNPIKMDHLRVQQEKLTNAQTKLRSVLPTRSVAFQPQFGSYEQTPAVKAKMEELQSKGKPFKVSDALYEISLEKEPRELKSIDELKITVDAHKGKISSEDHSVLSAKLEQLSRAIAETKFKDDPEVQKKLQSINEKLEKLAPKTSAPRLGPKIPAPQPISPVPAAKVATTATTTNVPGSLSQSLDELKGIVDAKQGKISPEEYNEVAGRLGRLSGAIAQTELKDNLEVQGKLQAIKEKLGQIVPAAPKPPPPRSVSPLQAATATPTAEQTTSLSLGEQITNLDNRLKEIKAEVANGRPAQEFKKELDELEKKIYTAEEKTRDTSMFMTASNLRTHFYDINLSAPQTPIGRPRTATLSELNARLREITAAVNSGKPAGDFTKELDEIQRQMNVLKKESTSSTDV